MFSQRAHAFKSVMQIKADDMQFIGWLCASGEEREKHYIRKLEKLMNQRKNEYLPGVMNWYRTQNKTLLSCDWGKNDLQSKCING